MMVTVRPPPEFAGPTAVAFNGAAPAAPVAGWDG
jgi:hypothetical protein